MRTRRYVSRFTCIAERCGDTCCRGLTVPLTAADARGLVSRLSQERDLLDRAVDAEAATLRPTADGHCGFLDAQRLCGLQRRFGPEALPEVCARFPRALSVAPGGLELSASLACPEVARLLLEEDALVLETVDDALRPPGPALELDAQAVQVRDALRGLLHQEHRGLSTRLALMAFLAHELAAGEVSFQELRQGFGRPDVLNALAERAAQLRQPGHATATLGMGLLRAWLTAPHPPQATFARDVLRAYGALEGALPGAQLWERYLALEQATPPLAKAELQRALVRWTEHGLDRRALGPAQAQSAVLELCAHAALLRLWLTAALAVGDPLLHRATLASALQLFAKYAAGRLTAASLSADRNGPDGMLSASFVFLA